jgi:hypothetical protein
LYKAYVGGHLEQRTVKYELRVTTYIKQDKVCTWCYKVFSLNR